MHDRDLLYFVRDPWPWGKPHEAAGLHRTYRRRRSRVAARGARVIAQNRPDRLCRGRVRDGFCEPTQGIPSGKVRAPATDFNSTAHADRAVRGLDLVVALVLWARYEPECAFRRIDSDTSRTLLRIIDELIEANSR